MRFWTVLFILLFSSIAIGGEIVLMTSLKLTKGNIRHLERKFKKTFVGRDIIIHHKTDPKTLYQVMTSEETEAVFWVSHAAGEQEVKPGFKAEDIILDFYGNDVKNFFTLVPKNLKFVGMIGCQAKQIFDGFRARGNYDAHPNLEILSYDKKVRLYPAFDKTIKAGAAYLAKSHEEKDSVQEHSLLFNIERTTYEESASLQSGWVEIGDQVLAFFDTNQVSAAGEIDSNVFNKIERKNIKFFRSKSATSVDDSLGKLSINPVENIGAWNLFAKESRPIGGRDQQLYVFKKP